MAKKRHDAAQIIAKLRFDAVLFDLDGVLTETARLHASCWKTTFDDFWRGVARHPDHQTALRAS